MVVRTATVVSSDRLSWSLLSQMASAEVYEPAFDVALGSKRLPAALINGPSSIADSTDSANASSLQLAL